MVTGPILAHHGRSVKRKKPVRPWASGSQDKETNYSPEIAFRDHSSTRPYLPTSPHLPKVPQAIPSPCELLEDSVDANYKSTVKSPRCT